MKELVDRYVRSLKERDDHPEHRNDLGALVSWILDREGFTVIERAFKHEEEERRVSKGRVQLGVDIIAIREEANELVSYRFVLKRGDVRNWTPGEPGSLAADLWLAAGEKEREKRYGVVPDRITVVAVHNGDRDSESLGSVIEGYLADMRMKTDVRTEWWDAARIVEKLVARPEADSSIFPPGIQPFVRMTLDSLLPERGAQGAGFDLAALDLLIERRFALRATATSAAKVEGSDELHRRIMELSLVASMIGTESTRVAAGNTLPVLDATERILCGATTAIGALTRDGAPPAKILCDDLRLLLGLYVRAAESLRARLEPLLSVENGLAVASPGESINYPLRALRLSGYLAVGGLAALATADESGARALANDLKVLWANNEGGCLQPITDDQLIEFAIAWELWTRLGMADEVDRTATMLIERLTLSRMAGLPLPALRQRARVPMRQEDLTVLVETRLGPRERWPSSFSDGGSAILPAALYVLRRRGATVDPAALAAFAGGEKRDAVFPQVWAPPDDAGLRWYREEIEYDGTAYLLSFDCSDSEFMTMFESAAGPIAQSTASRCGVDVVDRMAWKVTRTPPPMRLLVELTENAGPGAATT